MFINLKAEMLRQGISIQEISKVLNIKTDTARLKINGKIPIRLEECQSVASLFDENNSLDYLFATKMTKTK